MSNRTVLSIFYSASTNQAGVIIAGVVAWMQTFVDTTLPVIQWIIALGTAILVLFNVFLKGMEIVDKFKNRNKPPTEEDST